ncbi:MAG: membrane protein insertase YidC [Methylocystis sp.]|nr:membrane protein insertase YidC [Methylocystis sp.]MCA3583008.1 membrane protein insertase YidC [Methylocystis sp.]MCA3587331.1 membrane protein insertase YidC [Methylocystis sp.]MCA3590413.1 membrane protein insertase YidC [Methylocystis sp.]
MQKETDNKNLFLAIGLSILVIIGWNYFYVGPQTEKQRQERLAQQTQQSTIPQPGAAPQLPGAAPSTAPNATPAPTLPGTPAAGLNREAALAQSPRVKIVTPRLTGSIALTGARIDDLQLTNYRETIDKTSPNIVLFSPSGSPKPYYAEFGWVAGQGSNVKVPNAQTEWTPSAQQLTPEAPLTLTWDNGQGLIFKRVISVDSNYMFTVTETVENKSGQPVTLFPYGLVSRHGTPETQGFYILHEGLIGVQGDKLQEIGYADLVKAKAKEYKANKGGFIGITDKYWASAIIPDQTKANDGRFLAGTIGATPTYQADVLMAAETVNPGASATVVTRLFAGAKETNVIDGYQDSLGIKNFDLLIDWGWFYFITKPLFKLMEWFYHLTGNFGVAILIVTVLIKAVFFPLANKSYVSMAKMKAAQPAMQEIQTRYKDDRMKMQQELMALYKKEKINPLAGCWPVLLQIPVFFALYKVLFVTIEMRQAPFFGWIHDLAAPDPTSIFNLFGLLPFTVPLFLMVGVWPIIMGITMWLQMKMNPEPTDPTQKMIFAWMPLVFTFMLASFPAGLVIYWAWNNILSVSQQYIIMKRMGVKVELWDNIRGMFKKAEPSKS